MKIKYVLPFVTLLLLSLSASATIIYNADDTNVSPIVNVIAGTTSQSVAAGVLSYSNDGLANYNAGIASTSNIDTLLGRPLLETETVVLRLTVDAIVGDLSANGYEFGLSPNGTGFRPSNHLIFQIRPNNTVAGLDGGAFDGGGTAAFGLNELSVRDGFSATLVADQAGYTFTFTDVVLSSGPAATYSGTFTSPTQFRDTLGAGHFYTTAQKAGTPNPMVVSISEASINVIPEPSSRWLFALGGILVLRKMRPLVRR